MSTSNRNSVIVRSARLSTIVHATEDVSRVHQAMANACPKQLFHHNMEERRVKGHHGNEIRTISLNLSRKSAQVYPGFLWSNLSSLDHDQVLSSLSELLDEKDILHLRLGKQDCYLGRLRINQEDPVKVEIGFSGLPRLQDEKIQKLKQLLNHFTKELA